MPITRTLLTSATGEYDGTDATSYTTATITPGGTNRSLVVVVHSGNAGTAATPTLTGLGLTWALRETVAVNGVRRTSVFTADIGATAVTPGALTIAFGGTTQVFAFWAVVEVVGAKTGTELVQATATGSGYSLTATAAMPTVATAQSVVLMAHVRNVQEAVTAPAGWTELAEVQQGGVTFVLNAATAPAAAPSYALGASRNWTMVTVELAEAVNTPTPSGPTGSAGSLPFPRRGEAFRVRIPAVDANGEFVTAALTSPTVHVSKDDGAFVVATNTLTSVTLPGGGNSGLYTLDLTPTEMTAAVVTVRADASNCASQVVTVHTGHLAAVAEAVWNTALATWTEPATFGEAANATADWLADPVDGLDVERIQTAIANVPRAMLEEVVGELNGPPSAAPTLEQLVGFLYVAARNDLARNTAGQVVLHKFGGVPFMVADTAVAPDGSIRRSQFVDPNNPGGDG